MILIVGTDSVGVKGFGDDVFFVIVFFVDFLKDVFELIDGLLNFSDVLGCIGRGGEGDGKVV